MSTASEEAVEETSAGTGDVLSQTVTKAVNHAW